MQPFIFVVNLKPVGQSDTKICKNCGFQLEPTYHFCPDCGQEHRERVVYFKQFILDFLGDYFTFDSKIIRSAVPLLLNPGHLTNEYLNGRRVRYIPPLRMYIFISIIFFILLGSTKEPLQVSGEELNAAFFDAYFNVWMPRLFFFLLPLFAFITYVIFRKRGRFYVSHFIFSLHFHAFVLLLFSVYIVVSSYILSENYSTNQWLLVLSVCLIEVYLLVSLRKVYDQKWVTTFFKLLLLNLIYVFSIVAVFIGIAVLIYVGRY